MKKLLIALFALTALTATANAQLWPNAPIVNGLSYCSATNNAVCTNTVPAGPALTGNETIPADTNLANGQQPQSVKIPMSVLGVGTTQLVVPLTGATVTATSLNRQILIQPAGTIAALTLVMPAATGLKDNQRLGVCTTQIVTTLTVTAGSGTTVLNAPTALLVPVATGAGSCVEFIYQQANTTFYRVQ